MLASTSTNTVLNEVSNGSVNEIAYSAYGHRSAGQPVSTNVAFNGELREAHTGWYLLGKGYRAFNPLLMRFHSPDNLSPFGEGGMNAYGYCEGDSINYVDPTGNYRFFHWLGKRLGIASKTAGNKTTEGAEIKVTIHEDGGRTSTNPLFDENSASFYGENQGRRRVEQPLSQAQFDHTARLIGRGDPFDPRNEYNVLDYRTGAIEELPMTPPVQRRGPPAIEAAPPKAGPSGPPSLSRKEYEKMSSAQRRAFNLRGGQIGGRFATKPKLTALDPKPIRDDRYS